MDVDCRDIKGRTQLFIASENEDLDKVIELLRLGADPNICDNDGNTPLHISVQKNKNGIFVGDGRYVTIYYITDALLQHHADPNITNHIGNTPLHTYVKYGLLLQSQQELFLQKGANTNIRNNDGDTPLHLSIKCMNGHLSKRNIDKNTVYNYAFNYRYLIDAGADPNIPDSNNVTPLFTAYKSGTKITKLMVAELLYAGAVNVNNDDAPRHYYVRLG